MGFDVCLLGDLHTQKNINSGVFFFEKNSVKQNKTKKKAKQVQRMYFFLDRCSCADKKRATSRYCVFLFPPFAKTRDKYPLVQRAPKFARNFFQ